MKGEENRDGEFFDFFVARRIMAMQFSYILKKVEEFRIFWDSELSHSKKLVELLFLWGPLRANLLGILMTQRNSESYRPISTMRWDISVHFWENFITTPLEIMG